MNKSIFVLFTLVQIERSFGVHSNRPLKSILLQLRTIGLYFHESQQKKRTNNLIIGRVLDEHIVDMVEFGFDNKSLV